MYRLRARLLMKVLHGAKPADIPVEQPAKFELIFNFYAPSPASGGGKRILPCGSVTSMILR
jgi:hypothetical protein